MLTNKHKKKENETFETKITQSISEKFKCICGIYFNSRTTLWRHNKKGINKEETPNVITNELILELIKNNQNNTIHNLVQNGTNSHNTTTNNTTNNNKLHNLHSGFIWCFGNPN